VVGNHLYKSKMVFKAF